MDQSNASFDDGQPPGDRKAGGATVQEAIAARCPMIINQIIPGQEEGNAEYIVRNQIGTVVPDDKETSEVVEEALAHRGRLWSEWRKNLEELSQPDASLRIAELILNECDPPGPEKKITVFGSGLA